MKQHSSNCEQGLQQDYGSSPELIGCRFLEHSNSSMPLLFDGFLRIFTTNREKLSPALLANLYANSMIYWSASPELSALRKPDGRFIWTQAELALHSELYTAPGLSTIVALILNASGRPSTAPFTNGHMIGTAIALGHALGLNRDPSDGTISTAEKSLRVNIWWQLVIADHWYVKIRRSRTAFKG
jgi:hypothetical protein